MEHWDHNTCQAFEDLGFLPAFIAFAVVTSVTLVCGFSVGVM